MASVWPGVKGEDVKKDCPLFPVFSRGTQEAALGKMETSSGSLESNEDGWRTMFGEMDLENTLESYEDFLIDSLESLERKAKEDHKISRKRVRGKHTKACSKCGYNDWMAGEIYFSGSGPPWAASDLKFCRSCHREWMCDELPDPYVTSEVKELRDAIKNIAQYRREKWSRESGRNVRKTRKTKKRKWHKSKVGVSCKKGAKGKKTKSTRKRKKGTKKEVNAALKSGNVMESNVARPSNCAFVGNISRVHNDIAMFKVKEEKKEEGEFKLGPIAAVKGLQ